jgi:hypothetical protein
MIRARCSPVSEIESTDGVAGAEAVYGAGDHSERPCGTSFFCECVLPALPGGVSGMRELTGALPRHQLAADRRAADCGWSWRVGARPGRDHRPLFEVPCADADIKVPGERG